MDSFELFSIIVTSFKCHIDQKVQLIPVIQFEPSDFSEVTEGEINFQFHNENASWGIFFQTCLEKLGIHGVQSINQNSWLVSINEFNEDNLKQLVRWSLRKRYDPEFADYIPAYLTDESDLYNWFPGGYVLMTSEEELISPTCCVGFIDIESWESIPISQDETWTLLWIGHPWVHSKLVDDRVIISEYCESNAPSMERSEEWLSIDRVDLMEAVGEAKQGILDFLGRVKAIIEEISREEGSNVRVIYEGE